MIEALMFLLGVFLGFAAAYLVLLMSKETENEH